MLERFFRYLTAKTVFVGGVFIVVQAFLLPHNEGAIAWVRLLQKGIPFLVVVDIVIGCCQRILNGQWPWQRWAWFVLALAPTYPFVLSPYGVLFALNSYLFWLLVCLVPLALHTTRILRQTEIKGLIIATITTLLGLWALEWMLRNQPNAPYTYSELSEGIPYRPRRMDSDSGFYAPFRLQRFRKNWTDSLGTLRKKEFHQQYTYNNWGFNDSNWPDSSSDSTEIWIALGDSFTEGVGAGPKGESNWPRLLQAKVRQLKPQVRILNAGVSGADPVLSLRMLDKLLLRFQPKVVVLVINGSDLDDIAERGGLARVYRPLHITPFEYGMMTSFVFRQLYIKIWGYSFMGLSPLEQTQTKQAAFATLNEIIQRLQAWGIHSNFSAKVYYLPGYQEMTHASQKPGLLSQLTNITSLYPCYVQHGAQGKVDTYYWPIDRHHTPKGYQLMAECIYESLPDSLKQPKLYTPR
jgi:lysophospholipase L1-like esterase